jgi:hypothetical protein
MRSWFLVMLAAVIGCGGDDAVDPPDVAGFDLLISSSYVRVYANFTDASLAGESVPHVPDVGACADLETDTASVFASTLSDVGIDGLALSNADPYPDKEVTSPFIAIPGVTTDTMFRATDAGVTIAVPIHAGGYLTATDVQVKVQGMGLLATWTAPTSDSVLVGYGGGLGISSCRQPAGTSQFLLENVPASGEVEVQPLAAPDVVDTELGTVRVFYGEIADAHAPQ